MNPIIEIQDLRLEIPRVGYARPVLNALSLSVEAGRSLGIVGESGSGKTLLARAMLGDLPRQARTGGTLNVAGLDVLTASPAELKRLRQRTVSMVFQDPRASVNPVHSVGNFLTEHVVRSGLLTQREADFRAVELLSAMRLRESEQLMRRLPGELSGGMLQRVVIASALMTKPDILLCDEATTALDVTTQAELVGILKTLAHESGVTLIFVTHDLELAGELCDDLCVLYAGMALEHGPTQEILRNPKHPYTAALLRSTPRLADTSKILPSIPGTVLPLTQEAQGCVFADRCTLVTADCRAGVIAMQSQAAREWRCIRSAERYESAQ